MEIKNVILVIVTALSLASCVKSEKTESHPGEPGMSMSNPMETLEIVKSNPEVKLKLAGELKPDQRTELFAKVNSYVKVIRVDIGDRVTKGQVLVELEAPEIQSQVGSARSKLEAQEAIYVSTKSTYDRMVKASGTRGTIASDALDQITARKLSDEAQLNAARSAYNELKSIQDYLIIRAPFNGTVTDRLVDQGAYVGVMSKEPLLVVENNSVLRLALSIPEANTSYVGMGNTISFNVRSIPQETFTAVVKRKSGSLDTKLRSEKIQADFANHNQVLKPNMVAETTILLQNSEPTFFIPRSALVESGTGVYVIRVENGKTKRVAVRKGRAMPDQFEIFGDLNEGDKILKLGSEEIQEGTEVTVQAKLTSK